MLTTRDEIALGLLKKFYKKSDVEAFTSESSEAFTDFSRKCYQMADAFIEAGAVKKPSVVFNGSHLHRVNTWIENLGDCPIPEGVKHRVKFRDGDISRVDDDAPSWRWSLDDEKDFDIIAFYICGDI